MINNQNYLFMIIVKRVRNKYIFKTPKRRIRSPESEAEKNK